MFEIELEEAELALPKITKTDCIFDCSIAYPFNFVRILSYLIYLSRELFHSEVNRNAYPAVNWLVAENCGCKD